MKKISILLIFGALFSTSEFFAQTLFSDNFATTATAPSATFSAWDNKDLTGSNPTNGKWQQWPASTNGGGLSFATAPNGFAFFRSATIVGNNYVDDNLPEDAALELKSPFSCATATKVFVEFSQYWAFNTSLDARISLEYSYDKTTWQVLFTDSVMQNRNMFYGGTATPSRVDATAAFAGKSTVYVRFRYKGSFSGSWAVDDLKVYVPFLNDLQVFNMTSPTYRPQGANQEFKFFIRNNGGDPLTSFKADLYVNGAKNGSSVTVSGLNVAPATIQEVTMISGWNPTPGFYTGQVRTIGEINGSGAADPTPSDNNTVIQDLVIYGSTVVNRKPLYEIYTSSTCPPCKPGNETFHSIVDTSDPTSYVSVKFQQDFPGTGDPYCTDETVTRRSAMYAISSIPRMEIDGGWDQNASSFTSAIHNSQRALPSIVEISGTYSVDKTTKKVTTSVSIKPLINLTANDAKLYIAIVEKETYDNVKTNGETKFEQVVKKMIPNQNGFSLGALTAGTTFKLDTSYTFPGSYRLPSDGAAANRIKLASEHTVENFDNLYVVAWVQRTNKSVLQAGTMLKSGSGGGSTASVTDSAFKSVDSTATAAVSTEISKTRKLLAGTEYSWRLVDSLLPSQWDIESICDNIDCYFMPINGAKKFTANADSTQNFLKVSINHKKSLGYGWALVSLYKTSDSAASVITTKFSLLVKKNTSGGGGDPNAIINDSTRVSLYNAASLSKANEELSASYRNLAVNTNVKWQYLNHSIPTPDWEFVRICDHDSCILFKAGMNRTFKIKQTGATSDFLKVDIKHNKKPGYGFVNVRSFNTADSAKTVKTTRFALLVSASSSITIASDASEKLLYYFDQTFFIDKEFNGAQLEVYDLNGKSVLNTRVNSDQIDFTPLTGGIYIARISKEGEILKSHKFTTAK